MTFSQPARTAVLGKRRPLAALAIVTLIVAGCGSSSDSGSSGDRNVRRDAGVRFAECMREHGVREFPDPDAAGELTIDGVLNGSSLDPDSATWKTAIAACKDMQPGGFTGGERSPEQQQGALAFAECIRENGVTDFPDPINGEPLVDTNRIPSAATDRGIAVLNAAMQKCRTAAAEAGVNRE